MKTKKITSAIALIAVVIVMIAAAVTTTPESVQQTPWALLPPLIAIILALVTKEVYSSLFIGIIAGALLYSGFNLEITLLHIFNHTVEQGGEEMSYGIISVLSDSYNVGILVFLVILGIMVQLMNRTGGSAAFGTWASARIKTREGAQLATIGLGLVNRTAPQLNVFFLSMPVKSALGIAMLIVYLPFIMDMLMYTKDTQILLPVQKLLGG